VSQGGGQREAARPWAMGQRGSHKSRCGQRRKKGTGLGQAYYEPRGVRRTRGTTFCTDGAPSCAPLNKIKENSINRERAWRTKAL
jgi:hypothetical protein